MMVLPLKAPTGLEKDKIPSMALLASEKSVMSPNKKATDPSRQHGGGDEAVTGFPIADSSW